MKVKMNADNGFFALNRRLFHLRASWQTFPGYSNY